MNITKNVPKPEAPKAFQTNTLDPIAEEVIMDDEVTVYETVNPKEKKPKKEE